ncbi:hypothetical protein RSSM_02197 [Rhodopirellula sallentina SM41]|uniref:Uncharacterized protein n=1 Tax=Rhodopirellula sallentina SM41 TaxID=1263870 RepID=M5U4G9_9BACT|nr:hypothetical protein RSSM_02197 [Rhodopirellula sallentina SM41]
MCLIPVGIDAELLTVAGEVWQPKSLSPATFTNACSQARMHSQP